MMLQAWSMDQIGMFLVLILVYAIFLLYQLFKRKEKLQYLAYVVATIPFGYLWTIGVDYLAALFFLFLFWTFALGRDLVIHYAGSKKETDFANSIVLYAVAVGIYFLYAAILPALVPDLKTRPGTTGFGGIVWLPNLDITNPFINPFRLLLTIDVFLMIIPMIYEIKVTNARIPVWPNIFLATMFALPTIYVLYTWILITDGLLVFGLLIGVLYFILLLSITKGKNK